MKVLKFVKTWRAYNADDLAAFDDLSATKIIAMGVAKLDHDVIDNVETKTSKTVPHDLKTK